MEEEGIEDELPPAVIQGCGDATRTGRLYGRGGTSQSGGGRGGGHGWGGSTSITSSLEGSTAVTMVMYLSVERA